MLFGMPHSAIFDSMFHLPLPILEKLARPVIVYLVLVILLRLFGKRELAQLNPFDLVVLLSLSNTVQNAIIGDDNSVTGGIIGAFGLAWDQLAGGARAVPVAKIDACAGGPRDCADPRRKARLARNG